MGFSRQEYWSGLPFPSPIEMKEIHYTLRTERNDQAPYFNGALIMCVEGGGEEKRSVGRLVSRWQILISHGRKLTGNV